MSYARGKSSRAGAGGSNDHFEAVKMIRVARKLLLAGKG